MNTPAPAPSKAHMQSLIDTSIRPNPYEPVVGDIYGREPSSRIDGLPLRVVVLALGEDDIDGDLSIMEDGREESLSNLPAYLASIHGIEPLGRVRAHADPEPAERVRGTIGPSLRIKTAVDALQAYHFTDGNHHKAWIANEALRALMGDKYAAWLAHEIKAGAEPKDIEGIAP